MELTHRQIGRVVSGIILALCAGVVAAIASTAVDNPTTPTGWVRDRITAAADHATESTGG